MTLENQKRNTIINGLLLLTILLLYFSNWVQFPFKLPLCALVIMAVTFYKSRRLGEIGFLSRISLWQTLLWTFLIVLIAAMSTLWTPFLESVFGKPDYSAYSVVKGNKDLVVQLWIYAMISAAFAEEVLFRGYFCFLVESVIGNSKLSRAIIVVAGAVLFSAAHYEQGGSGVINIFIISLVFYLVFIRSGKNIYATILAHAIIDTYSLYQIFLGNL